MAACLIAAAGLQWAALRVAGSVLGVESPGRRVPTPVRLAWHGVASARPTASPLPTPTPMPTGGAEPALHRPAPAAVTPPPSVRNLPDAPADSRAADDAYRFYSAGEVDVTAEPVSQWNLDPAALDALAISRIVFTLFVGSDGSVLHCSVDEPERLSPGQRQALVASLAGSAMRPALRAGVPVPSRRQVELFVVGGP